MYILTCQCGQRMKAPPELMGKTCRCVKCGARLPVTPENVQPLSSAAPAKPPTGSATPAPPQPVPAPPIRARVGELLVAEGLVKREQLDQALAQQAEKGGKTFEILISLGFLDKAALHDFLSKQSGVASIDLTSYAIPKDLVDLIPKQLARENLVLPIDRLGKLLTVGMACPLDVATIAKLQELTGLRVKPMLCKYDDILATIERYYPPDMPKDEDEDLALQGFSPGKSADVAAAPAPPLAPAARTAPPAEIVQALSEEETRIRLAHLESLPVMGRTMERVRAAGATPADLLDAIGKDPGAAALILRAANTPVYGMAQGASDLAVATALLGAKGIQAVLASARKLAEPWSDSELAEFAQRSVFRATLARALARECAVERPGAAYASALLRDSGAMALACIAPEAYRQWKQASHGDAFSFPARDMFGVTPLEASAALADAWEWPEALASSMRARDASEASPEAHRKLALVVVLAERLAHPRNLTTDEIRKRVAELTAPLGLAAGDVERLYAEAERTLDGPQPVDAPDKR